MRRSLRKKLIIFGLSLLCIVIFYQVIIDPITTTFSVTADTERIEIVILDENGSQLNLYEVDIYNTEINPIYKKFNGSLRLNKGTSVIVERTAYGPAILTFSAPKKQSVGTLFNETSSSASHTGHFLQIFFNDIKLKADNGQSIILPIDGKVNLGRSIDFETFEESTAVLKGGEINMTGSSTFSNNFEAGTTPLYLGDQISFDDQNSKAFGFITINEKPGMQAAYRVIAKQATILKPGPKVEGSGFIIRATFIDRLSKASFFQITSLIIGAFGAFISLIASLKDTNIFKELINLFRQ